MITALVGHRGTGKTGLLARLARLRPDARGFDLDARIAEAEGQTIDAIFADHGEAAFRQLEHAHLNALVREAGDRETHIAIGAGFTGPLPTGMRCLWVRRDTDAAGRIFLDRPRLDPTLDPLEEFRDRFAAREARYRAWADEVLTLGEGFVDEDPAEARFFRGDAAATAAWITLLPEHVRTGADGAARLAVWVERMRALGVAKFELRDDLLTPEALTVAVDVIDTAWLLFSRRRPATDSAVIPPGCELDWDLSLGACPHGTPTVLSLHAREPDESVSAAAARLEEAARLDAATRSGPHRKLAIEIADLAELLAGREWAAQDPARRSFLPRSRDGRWAWYRLLHAADTPVHFVREGAGSAADQPTLLQWLRFRPGDGKFAAVLGDPVAHSRTPATHHAFFTARRRPILAVRLDEPDQTAKGLDRLTTLGLRHAAVTAPLKGLAHAACATVTETARALDAVNTLRYDEGERRWHGANTDRDGFEALRPAAVEAPAVAVWGGGGTRAMLVEVFPAASFHAARTGAHTGGPMVTRPEIVVWATGRVGATPPAAWRPARVIDLDYREDAPGRAYALAVGARYISGLAMFERQAAAQRVWWESFEE